MHRVEFTTTVELPLERSPRCSESVSLFADVPPGAVFVDRELEGDDDDEMFRPFE